MKVGAVLADKGHAVFTAHADQTLFEAAVILRDRGIGAVVVTDVQGMPIGILSERDIVRALATHGSAVMDQPIGAFMTADVICCSENDGVEDILDLMTRQRFRHVPVVTDGQLVGLISIGDAVKIKIEEIEAEAAALKTYIHSAS
ncbi:MAG: CBS domain-containing protein [Alphaproteobacteria bacterium]